MTTRIAQALSFVTFQLLPKVEPLVFVQEKEIEHQDPYPLHDHLEAQCFGAKNAGVSPSTQKFR